MEKIIYVAIGAEGTIVSFWDRPIPSLRNWLNGYAMGGFVFHNISVESTEGLIGRKLEDVSLLHRELCELRESIALLKGCAIYPPEDSLSVVEIKCEADGTFWSYDARSEKPGILKHPSLHSALKSLLGETKDGDDYDDTPTLDEGGYRYK